MDELRRLVDTGLYLRATRHFQQLRRSGKYGVHDLARIYRLASTAYHGISDVHTARELGRAGADLAEEAGDVDLTLGFLRDMVELERLAGDTAEALKFGERWLQTAAEHCPNRRDGCGALHYNLALVYRQRRDTKLALIHFYQALEYLREHHILGYYLMAAQMTAWTHYEQGQLQQGDTAAAEAQRILAETPSDREAIKEQLLLRALRAYMAGDYGQAAPLCEDLLADPEISALQTFWVNWIAAACAVRSYPATAGGLAKDVKQSALFFSAQALDMATRLRQSELLNRANEIQREAEALPGSFDQAG